MEDRNDGSVAILNEDGNDDTEFWNKPPSVLRQACDNMSRLIFAANSRANWIFDLQMYTGNLYTWSRIDRDNGFAFGLQKKPFVFDIDFIDREGEACAVLRMLGMVSVLVESPEVNPLARQSSLMRVSLE